MAKKILWICNKEYIIENELGLLVRLGYEYYVPKIGPLEINVNSDNQNINSICLSKRDSELLDETDFYYGEINEDVMEVINRTFDIAIFGLYIEPIISFVEKFHGIMLVRPYGNSSSDSYTDFFVKNAGMWMLEKISRLGNRFWITEGYLYGNINDECEILKKRTIALPFCIGENRQEKKMKSTGKTLFCCDNIKLSETAEKSYKMFSKEFQEIPYIITGIQPIDVNDDNRVHNHVKRQDVLDEIRKCSAVFCKDIQFGEIPEYYYEAFKNNIPVVFLKKSNIGRILGSDFVGGCRNIKQAKKELKYISKKLSYKEKISQIQADCLNEIRTEKLLDVWRKSFEFVNEVKENNILTKKNKKIGIITLSSQYNDAAILNATKLVRSLNDNCNDIEIVWGCQANQHSKTEEHEFENVEKRNFYLEKVTRDRVTEIVKLKDFKEDTLQSNSYYLLNDGIQYFNDCDYLVFVGKLPQYPVFITKPYGILEAEAVNYSSLKPDYYVGFYRSATAIYGFNKHSLLAIANCIGIPQKKCHEMPMLFEKHEYIKEHSRTKKKFVIVLSENTENNYDFIFLFLIRYYNSGGNMKCILTMKNTNKNNYAYKNFKEFVMDNLLLKRNVTMINFFSSEELMNEISQCSFGLYPYGLDNNDILFDALANTTPFIINDIPELREFVQVMGLKDWCLDFTDTMRVVDKMFEFEKKHIEFSNELSKKENFFDEFISKKTSDHIKICDIILDNAVNL